MNHIRSKSTFAIRMLTYGYYLLGFICHRFPFLPVNVRRYGDAKWCHRDHHALCLFSAASVLFFPCIFNPPPTTIVPPVFYNVPDIFLHDSGNLDEAKIKRRLHDYPLTCVLLSDSTRAAVTKIPGSFWQTLTHHGVRLCGFNIMFEQAWIF